MSSTPTSTPTNVTACANACAVVRQYFNLAIDKVKAIAMAAFEQLKKAYNYLFGKTVEKEVAKETEPKPITSTSSTVPATIETNTKTSWLPAFLGGK